MMRFDRLIVLAVVIASTTACAVKAQVRTEEALPLLDPPPPPPRMVAIYPEEPEFVPAPPAVEAASPTKPAPRPPRVEAKPDPEPAAAPVPVQEANVKPANAPALTLTPSPGTESQTAAAIRDLIARASRDLARVNTAALNSDGRTQFDTARRFLEQAEEALKARNVVFAGKLADKAATMAAVLVR